MPMHDWSRVRSGTYHNFHYRWIAAMMDLLNAGMMPPEFFAMAEQKTSGVEPDVVTLSASDVDAKSIGGGVALVPPKASVVEKADKIHYARKTDRVAIHHDTGKIVAIIELVSPGNKDTRHALRSFSRKAAAFIRNGVHVLVVDPFPPGRYDPNGIHPAVWENIASTEYQQPVDQRLTAVSYQAGSEPTAYVEPFAVGGPIPDMPLFLVEDFYITVPLEETYQTTWNVSPQQIRKLVEG
ncbi:MAG: DUF4058 family protein [Fimbriiglobus sp.]|nr:DUF4058 family protein [Fimbriiglobus sp.]